MPLVEPPIASSTRIAFSNAAGGEDLVDRQPIARHLHRLRAAVLGDAHAVGGDRRRRRAARHVMPSASAMQAIVLAVPITEQVPTLATSWSLTSAISSASISSAR